MVNTTFDNPSTESLANVNVKISQSFPSSETVSFDPRQDDISSAKHPTKNSNILFFLIQYKFVAYKGTKLETFFSFATLRWNIYNILVRLQYDSMSFIDITCPLIREKC
jgi:hypothetical protein